MTLLIDEIADQLRNDGYDYGSLSDADIQTTADVWYDDAIKASVHTFVSFVIKAMQLVRTEQSGSFDD